MAALVQPHFEAWTAPGAGGFGGNLTVVDKVPPRYGNLFFDIFSLLYITNCFFF